MLRNMVLLCVLLAVPAAKEEAEKTASAAATCFCIGLPGAC